MAAGPPKDQPIIIRRVKKVVGGGHHGGAWKVAYADFVTAMMAFFLLLWLLNVTTAVQRKGIADYFAPASISKSESGAGGVFGGRTVSAPEAKISDSSAPGVDTMEPQPAANGQEDANGSGQDSDVGSNGAQIQYALANAKTPEQKAAAIAAVTEQKRFESAEAAIHEMVQRSADLKALSGSIQVDETPEGLRIQLIDRDGLSMFPVGSSDMYPRTRKLLQSVAKIIATLPNRISISGHTDGRPYPPGATRNNWDLSSDRANASRRVLEEANIPDSRIQNVVGRADRDPFDAKDPLADSNRRISIILLRDKVARRMSAASAAADGKIDAKPANGSPADGVVSPMPPIPAPPQPLQTPAPASGNDDSSTPERGRLPSSILE